MHILSVGADIKEFFATALEEWIEEIIVCSDSEIALCWTCYETVKLNQYNRVRVLNITSKLNLQDLFHVKGTHNPADIGTRVKNVSASDVSPSSEYIGGKEWMKLSRQSAAHQGFIKSVQDIKLGHEQKKMLKKGIVFDSFEKDDPDIFGILMPARINTDKVALREAEVRYPFSPLKRNFLSFVEVIAIVLKVSNKWKNKSASYCKRMQDEEKQSRFTVTSYYSTTIVRSPPDLIVNEVERSNVLNLFFVGKAILSRNLIRVKLYLRPR